MWLREENLREREIVSIKNIVTKNKRKMFRNALRTLVKEYKIIQYFIE
jgi:hypothetical protein